MNCANHPETPAVAFCRECGKAMCPECQRPALGSVYCEEHLPVYSVPPTSSYVPPASSYVPPTSSYVPPASSYSAPYTHTASPYNSVLPTAVPDPGVHPGLALILGFFPGVGAIYNGQYAKGLVHAVIFGLLITTITNSHNNGIQAMLGVMIGVWVIYQAFEAFHTARQRRYGYQVEEFSSLFEARHGHGRFPGGALILICVGFVLLLNTTDIIRMDELERYWPGVLILIGLYLLYVRLNPVEQNVPPADGEVRR